ncbi:MAG: helical backbone metal receptor [Chitinophagales bacterium]|jgi:ABC-type Fe3+-hydroxamate transport system substrate-binding protein
MSWPNRIVSLVPSQTELLYDLGLDREVVGITKFCIHPQQWYRSKTRVGGTKTVDVERVLSLHPNWVIANKEENVREQVEAISRHCSVYVSDIKTLEDAYNMMVDVGKITGKVDRAMDLVDRIRCGFEGYPLVGSHAERVLYVIWRKPWMAAGGDTFIHSLISRCGWQNILADQLRYPEFTAEQLKKWNPDRILLSSEPYPFKERHVEEFRRLCPEARIQLVDGEMFSWYGSRLLQSVDVLRSYW